MIKINDQIFANETFANGEVIYKEVTLNSGVNRVSFYFETNKDLADLMMAVSYIRSMHADSKIMLFMPYIPYSRMDRKINEQLFSLGMFADIINSMRFDKVVVLDPHSSTSEARIRNLHIVDIEHIIMDIAKKNHVDAIMFPDKGARTKYIDRYKNLCAEYPVLFGEKKRDLENKGHILGYKILGDEFNLQDKNVLIVDDLCVYGNTFKFCSIELKKNGANKVYLWITHCENAIFDGPLFNEGHINHAFTTNSMIRYKEHDCLTTIEI